MSAMRLLIRLLLLFRVGGDGGMALGLVNVPQITRPTAWSTRSLGTCPPLFVTPKATVSPSISAAETQPDQVAKLASENAAPTLASPPEVDADNASQVGTDGSNNVPLREGIWVPPSQNLAQRRGKVFSIQQPQDLLDFVIEDERLSVVKVYASWCKTCKVFDVRYRKLASQVGDKYDDKTGTEITKSGRARFAEMQYDNIQNEEMCKLLNATKLPYILMYKGSQGKVKEFQCGPAKFQMLVDAVNELADPIEGEGVVVTASDGTNVELGSLAASPRNDVNTTTVNPATEDTMESLKQQLLNLENEKVEMFEIMKAQIEHDKLYIQKLEAGVETQRSMLEAKDGEISNLTTTLKEEKSVLISKAEEVQTLTGKLNLQQKETQKAKEEVLVHKSEIAQLMERTAHIEKAIASLELAAKEKEKQILLQMQEWDKQKQLYEEERNSFRKLFSLGAKRIGRGLKSSVSKLRR